MLFGVLLQQLTACPLDGKKVKARVGLPDLDGSDHVRVQNTGAVLSFTHEARDRSAVVAQLFPQNLECYGAVA